MEVLLGDEPFASLIEEYMGPDSRRYFELLIDTCEEEATIKDTMADIEMGKPDERIVLST